MEQYEKLFATKTEFFSTYNPDMIEEALVNQFTQDKVDIKVNKNKYKIKFTLES
jgi:hypothetical protein